MTEEKKIITFPETGIITEKGSIVRIQESCELEVQQILNENTIIVHKNTPISQYEKIMGISCLNNNIENVKKLTEFGILQCNCVMGMVYAIMFNNNEIVDILLKYGVQLYDYDTTLIEQMAKTSINQLDLLLKAIRPYPYHMLKIEIMHYKK